jgi:hypothetical protein
MLNTDIMQVAGTEFPFTERDRKVIIKAILRQLFPSLTVFLLLFLISLIYFSLQNISWEIFFLLISLSAIIGIGMFLFVSNKYRQDLKINKVKLEKGIIEKKEYRLVYEPGSASMPVGILTIFFPKIYSREMKGLTLYEVSINGEKYTVEKEKFEYFENGDHVYIKRGYFSNLYLGLIPETTIESP